MLSIGGSGGGGGVVVVVAQSRVQRRCLDLQIRPNYMIPKMTELPVWVLPDWLVYKKS